MNWFLAERDSLPDMAIALAAVIPSRGVLNKELDEYLRRVEDYCDEQARGAEFGL